MAKRLRSRHLLDLAFVSDPQIGPRGERAAAVISHIEIPDNEAPRYRSRIKLYRLDGGAARDFTRGDSDNRPRFSPDGSRLAYLSKRKRDAEAQLQLIALDGGEGRTLTGHRTGVSELCWHPNGRQIAYLTRGDRRDSEQGGGRRLTSRRYKLDGVGFLPAAETELRLIDAGDGSDKLLDRFEWEPVALRYDRDGHLFVAASDERDERHAQERGYSQIFRYSKKGKRGRGLLPESELIAALSPAPDGASLAYIAPVQRRDISAAKGLWLLPIGARSPSLLSGDLEATPSLGGDARYGRYDNTPAWNEAGSALLANVNIEGRSGLARIRLDGNRNLLNIEDRAVTAFAAHDGRAVFTAERPDTPGELFVRYKNGRERTLGRENEAFVARHDLRPLEGPYHAEGAEGARVGYWSLAPKRPRKDGARVIQIHGGPHTNYGYGFYFEFQLLAAAGYRVVFGNPRGSSSFGSDFAQALLGAYGGVDADDVHTMCNDADRRYGSAPVHLTGGSYGGFMTNWLVGHSDRFTSAVTQRSICNWLSFYGSSDIGYRFADREIGGVPWESFEHMWQQSPLRSAAAIDTPLLILHAEQDHRCPIEQAEQLFVALSTIDRVPTELIRFPDEGHELSRSGRPDRRIERLDAIVDWFERFPKRR